MIRRFLHHFLWNFYDYLGSYLLLGSLTTFGVLLMIWVSGLVLTQLTPGVGQIIASIVLGLLVLAFLTSCFAGIAGFSAKVARQEPARLPDFKQAARELFWPYAKILVLYTCFGLIAVADLAFYMRYGATPNQVPLGGMVFVAGLLFIWIAIGTAVLFFPLSATPARFPEERRLVQIARRGFILFIIAPGFWFATALLFVLFGLVCLVSVIGVLALVPVLACMACTALEIVVKHVDFLTKARQQLGDGRPVLEYRRKALQLAWEWEEQQPRRTLKELIKPWEM